MKSKITLKLRLDSDMKTLLLPNQRSWMDNRMSKPNNDLCDVIFDDEGEIKSEFSEWKDIEKEEPWSTIDRTNVQETSSRSTKNLANLTSQNTSRSWKLFPPTQNNLTKPVFQQTVKPKGFDKVSSSTSDAEMSTSVSNFIGSVFDDIEDLVSRGMTSSPQMSKTDTRGNSNKSSGFVTGGTNEVSHSISPNKPSTLLYGISNNQLKTATFAPSTSSYCKRKWENSSRYSNKGGIKRLNKAFPSDVSSVGGINIKSASGFTCENKTNRKTLIASSESSTTWFEEHHKGQNSSCLFSNRRDCDITQSIVYPREEGEYPNSHLTKQTFNRTLSSDFIDSRRSQSLDKTDTDLSTDIASDSSSNKGRRYSLTETATSYTTTGPVGCDMGIYTSEQYRENNSHLSKSVSTVHPRLDRNIPKSSPMMVQNEMKTYAVLGEEQSEGMGLIGQPMHHFQQTGRPSHSIINYVGSPVQHGHSPEVIPVDLSPSPPVHDSRMLNMGTSSPGMSRSSKVFNQNPPVMGGQRQMHSPHLLQDNFAFRRAYDQPGIFDTRDIPNRNFAHPNAQSIFSTQGHQAMYPFLVKGEAGMYSNLTQGLRGEASAPHYSGYQSAAQRNANLSSYLKPPPVDLDELSEEERERMKIKRERNRVAAAKCRNRRRELLERLEKEAEQLEREGEVMRDNVRRLQVQKRELANLLETHEAICENSVNSSSNNPTQQPSPANHDTNKSPPLMMS